MHDLISSVQRNCDISDARHAGDSAMCIYLMRMREHYKWINDTPLGKPFDHKSLGGWIETREAYLESLESCHYSPLRLGGDEYDPFDQVGINRRIGDDNMAYCAGYGARGKPVFCLAERIGRESTDDYETYILGREYAREMSAPVAMSQRKTIVVRRDALLRMVWEMFEEWSWRKPRNSFYKAIAHFGYPDDTSRAARALAENELDNLVLHEIGEILAGDMLGDRWNEMLLALLGTPLEFLTRSVRDNLADSLTVLPTLMFERNAPSIHFYFAGSHPVRDQLFPMLKQAYRSWDDTQTIEPLKVAVRRGRSHWLETAQELMTSFDEYGDDCMPHIQSVIDRCAL